MVTLQFTQGFGGIVGGTVVGGAVVGTVDRGHNMYVKHKFWTEILDK